MKPSIFVPSIFFFSNWSTWKIPDSLYMLISTMTGFCLLFRIFTSLIDIAERAWISFFPAVNGILAALFHIQSVRYSHNSSLDCELWNLGFVSVNRVKSLCSYDSPLLFPINARQESWYDLSGERDAKDLMVLPMGDHSQVVQH